MKKTIHRALAELKTLDARIEKQIIDFEPCGARQEGKPIMGGNPARLSTLSNEDFGKGITEQYQSITSLINQKNKIKKAIVNSNAITQVKIGGEEMNVADAITKKETIKFEEALVARIRRSLGVAEGIFNTQNERVEANLQKILENNAKDKSVDSASVEALTVSYRKLNNFALVDPLKAKEKAEELDKKIQAFKTEVDAVLSESNATTFIEIAD